MKNIMMMHGWGRRWCNKHTGLLVLRVVLGVFFFAHGTLKWQDMEQTVAFFGSLGFPSFLAYLVAIAETGGGVALVLGVFTCFSGSILAVIQLVAAYKVTSQIPADSALVSFAMGYGMNLVLAAASLAVAFAGPGRWALWKGRCCWWCRKDKNCMECKDCASCGHCGPMDEMKSSPPSGPSVPAM